MVSNPFIDLNWSKGVNAKGQPIPDSAKEPKTDGALVSPSSDGATNWPPPSFDPETGLFVNTVAFGITDSNTVMSQIHNSKKRMPSILTEDLAWEWLMEKPTEERLSQIARTQIPSRLLEFCTVDRNYRTTLEATPLEYPELAAIDTTFVDTEELKFNHWQELQTVKA